MMEDCSKAKNSINYLPSPKASSHTQFRHTKQKVDLDIRDNRLDRLFYQQKPRQAVMVVFF